MGGGVLGQRAAGRSRLRATTRCGRSAWRSATSPDAPVSPGVVRLGCSAAAPSGSRAWASKPAETSIRSGAKASSAGSRRSLHGAAEARRRRRRRQRRVDDVARRRAPRGAGAGVERQLVDRGDRTRVGSCSKIAWVPLPWWTSKSTIATRSSAVRLARVRGGDGDVVEQAEAHRRVGLGVVARRAHGAEGVLGAPRRQHGVDGGDDGAGGALAPPRRRAGAHRGVAIELSVAPAGGIAAMMRR